MPELIRVLVVDDEPLARQRLATLLARQPEAQLVGEASNGDEALQQAQRLRPDVVLLDIRMPGRDGLSTAAELARQPHPPAVIFTTAYDNHALAAFETAAAGYLLKPIRAEQLSQALTRAQRLTRAQLSQLQEQQASTGRSHIEVRRQGNLEIVPVDEIRYFLAEDKYVVVGLQQDRYLIESSLKQLEQEFGGRFIRIHRNALVAIDALCGLEQGPGGSHLAHLRGVEERLEVSRRHVAELRRLLRESGSAD